MGPLRARAGIRVACAVALVLFAGLASAAWTATRVSVPAAHPLATVSPVRVLSVNITGDEILLDLAPELLIGVSYLASDPQASNVVAEAERVPVHLKGDTERILDLRPDLVVIGAHNADIARQIEAMGLRLVRIQGFESIDWIRGLIRTLGVAVNRPDRAAQLIESMDHRLEAVSRRVAGRPRPLVLAYSALGFAAGSGTITDDVIRAAGGENLAAKLGIKGWKKVSLEQILIGDPEVLLLRGEDRWFPGFYEALLTHPALRQSRAVKGGRIHALPSRLLITSSHHIAETVEAVARVLHPEAFAGAGM